MKGYVADHRSTTGVVLRDLPPPHAGPGVTVVNVVATSLNRGEVQHVRAYRSIPDGEPVGWDFAGVVAEAATDGSGPAVGTPVFGWCQARGSWSEQVAVPVAHVAPVPPGLSLVDASTLGVAGLTAHAALACARSPLSSASVLVTGATGGVGLFALQLARVAGASTIASVRRAENAASVREAIGDPELVVEVGVELERTPVDLVVETVGGPLLSAALCRVAPGGTVVSLGRTDPRDATIAPDWFLKGARLDGLRLSRAYAEAGSVATVLDELASLVAAGRLRTNVARTVPAARLPEAMDALIERSVLGKVVVSWTNDPVA